MKRETKIPGIKAQHRWVTDECFQNRGLDGVIKEVTKSVEDEIRDLYQNIPKTSKIHIVVTVEHE